ncbi:uncharacterized protein LOC124949254 isoform X1 [Vespa velutina]|uniref:uncharacterized protein LOC124949254 isoform X1 n=1 Tax=Vespa velutina TaxID=202808 RepID=UPI001FB21659|nr:uncharacterized protein LOC124949254 isoform X1 [Vespa velutina]
MMDKSKNSQKNVRHEKVLLQKTADRVEISGNYTKREFRKFLLSPSISSLISDSEDKTKLEKTLETGIKLSQVDIDKIKKDKIHGEIGKKDEQILDNPQVTRDIIGGVLKKEQYENDETRQRIYKETMDIEESKKGERKAIEKYLREKGLSTSLIKSVLTNGFTDEYIRLLLKSLHITEDEIEYMISTYQMELNDSTSSIKSCSSTSSDYYLSSDSLYLKNLLSKALTRALPEIASKKPYDPIEYLGHWLLHLKISEEQRNKQREFELELMIEREKYKMMMIEDQETMSIESRGEEELIVDTNFINYTSN